MAALVCTLPLSPVLSYKAGRGRVKTSAVNNRITRTYRASLCNTDYSVCNTEEQVRVFGLLKFVSLTEKNCMCFPNEVVQLHLWALLPRVMKCTLLGWGLDLREEPAGHLSLRTK